MNKSIDPNVPGLPSPRISAVPAEIQNVGLLRIGTRSSDFDHFPAP
ncbi:MAG: hypothetical protein ACI97A_001858 [Planctomycetota bacterium]|jgi:hypothetical protein